MLNLNLKNNTAQNLVSYFSILTKFLSKSKKDSSTENYNEMVNNFYSKIKKPNL